MRFSTTYSLVFKMIGRIFILFLVAHKSCYAQTGTLGFQDACGAAGSQCLPRDGCRGVDAAGAGECGEDMICCAKTPIYGSVSCGLNATELGHCTYPKFCDSKGAPTCWKGGVCCPKADLPAAPDQCYDHPQLTGYCIQKERCAKGGGYMNFCSDDGMCCKVSHLPQLGETCGMNTDQGTCANVTDCIDSGVPGTHCTHDLVCCQRFKGTIAFGETCGNDEMSQCLPSEGCAKENTNGAGECIDPMVCCASSQNLPGLQCALQSTDFGVCSTQAFCHTAETVSSCSDASTCCPMSDLPGKDENCGTDTDQRKCLDAADCSDDGLSGTFCKDGLTCCTSISKNAVQKAPVTDKATDTAMDLGKTCGHGGSCQKECCGSAVDETGDCGSNGLVCCVPGLGMNCQLPEHPMLEATCVLKSDCPKGRKKRNRECSGRSLTCCATSAPAETC